MTVERCDAFAKWSTPRASIYPSGSRWSSGTRSRCRVCGDPDKVSQILANLLDNAGSTRRTAVVEVRLARNGNAVRFSVQDEGLGIPVAEQRRIFEKFYQVDPNLSRGISGTGLGLYICRELVRRMDGHIWVDSREGGGSTFAFELPIATRARGTAAGRPR